MVIVIPHYFEALHFILVRKELVFLAVYIAASVTVIVFNRIIPSSVFVIINKQLHCHSCLKGVYGVQVLAFDRRRLTVRKTVFCNVRKFYWYTAQPTRSRSPSLRIKIQ